MKIDREAMAAICRRNDIARLRLFGSFARGEADDGSDVDLIADFLRPKSLLELVRIQREFSEVLGRDVDLLTERSLSPHLRERIVRDAQVVYERAA
ncbi:MAG: nucleotidyltransferase family protein [Candidatus Palauibacterales bacterium]|nr:nucleotidyltransferase family protein [Candidatus Palauibacterales bacterium]MDP2530820.1 nucleotidyltransferase family protein [Candidatus Palauibacterales bacterium]MDP2583533.1 nucleotidyltransferase family protein [Candidatus Palauibacterales bacterium]